MNARKDLPPFIGYAAAPGWVKRFYWFLIPLVLTGITGLGYMIGAAQDDPGDGTWDASQAVELEGYVQQGPYPMIHVNRPQGGIETIFLVNSGKTVPTERGTAYWSRMARVKGFMIERAGRRMLELTDTDDAFGPAKDSGTLKPPLPVTLRRATLRGEIIDSKCFLGAMHPGHGRTHKACARLCLLGGIPPLFVLRHEDGRISLYLVTNETGGPVTDEILDYVADPVEMTGDLVRQADLVEFRIDPTSIRRL